MKLLYYTKYTRLAASSRLRSFQYFSLLEKNGCSIKSSPLFNDQYLKELYKKKGISKLNVAKQYFKRCWSLLFVNKYDLIIIEKELFPYFPAFFERIISLLGVKYVADYDDAIFHNYDKSKNLFIRFFLKQKINTVIRFSALASVGNKYLQQKAIKSGAKKILLLPTVIDKNRYIKKDWLISERLIIGWIGTPQTLKYLSELIEVFIKLGSEFKFKIHIVGGKSSIGLPDIEEIIEWSEETEVCEIRKFDIGIMPLKDSDWEKGKCAYKIIQYMACGVPVIGSDVGANASVIKDAHNGYLVKSKSDWYEKIKILLTNQNLRLDFGDTGYKTVMEKYTLQSVFQQYFSTIKSIR